MNFSTVKSSAFLLVTIMGLGGMVSTSNADVAAYYNDELGVGLSVGLSVPEIGYTNTAWGQTFLSHATGALSNVSIFNMSGTGPQDLTLTVWSSDGVHLFSQLGSKTVTADQVGTPTNFDFSDSSISILDGTNYGWTLSVATGSLPTAYGLGAHYGWGYTEGRLLFSTTGITGMWSTGYAASYSVPFEVDVAVPSAPGLAVALLGGLLTGRRRR